jgi:adenylate cyclase
MSNLVRLRLLGPAQIERAGQPGGNLLSGKALALLGYLSVRGQPLSRANLAHLFWPGKPADRGRANLSWLLHRILSRLPGCLDADRHSLRFRAGPPYWLDLHAFADLLGQGDAAALAEAVALYRGDLLEGLHLDGCSDFEVWLVGERERWRRRAAGALRELVAHHSRSGNHREALRHARRLLDLEPWREEGHRQVMQLLARGGQRGAALAQYEACRRILAQELNVEPGPATAQLYEQIRHGVLSEGADEQRGGGAVPPGPVTLLPFLIPPPVHDSSPAPFVVRQRELAQLDGFLDAALAGYGQVVFVTGDAGQGKTALIQEFARRAQQSYTELVVAGGRGQAHSGSGDPYLPFREVLDLLTGDVQAPLEAGAMTREQARRLWQALPLAAQALVESGPDLIDTFVPGDALLRRTAAFARPTGEPAWLAGLERLVERKAALPADPTLQQSALFRQYTRVLRALASQRGLLLLLDDLQWADAGSISLLFHLGRELPGRRILVVGAYRPAEVALGRGKERHPLAPVVNELGRAFGEVDVALAEDDPAFVGAFLDTEPNRLSASFREMLTRQTGGHPLFTIELLRGMQERGDLMQDEAGRWAEGPALDWETLPARVEAIIAERVGRLPGSLQEALTVASVEGETFTAEVVARVGAVNEAEMLRRLSGQLDRRHRLVHAQGVRRVADHHLSQYRFRHILFQRYLYGRLNPVERAHLHRAVGTELETVYGVAADESMAVAGQLARHFEAGGVLEKAVVYRLQAGQRATRLSAHEEAIAHFRHGLDLLYALPHTPARDEQELALQVGLAVSLLPRKGYSVPEVGRAYARARELCQRVAEPPQRFQVLWLTYTYHGARGEHRTAHALGQQLLRLAQGDGDMVLAMLAHWALGWNRFFVGEFVEARAHLEQVVASYDPERHRFLAFLYGQDPGAVCRSKLACVLWSLGYPEQGLAQRRDAVALAEELAHPYTLAYCQGLAALFHLFSRDVQAARAPAEAGIRLSDEYGFPYWLASSTFARGWSLVEQGRTESGLAQMRRAMVGFEATGSEIGFAQLHANLAEAHGKAGQIEEGLALLDRALTFAQRNGEDLYEAETHRLRGELSLRADGRKQNAEGRAERDFLRAIEVARRQAARSWELRAVISLSRLWRRQGRREEARRLLAGTYDWFTEGFDTPDLREARALLHELT